MIIDCGNNKNIVKYSKKYITFVTILFIIIFIISIFTLSTQCCAFEKTETESLKKSVKKDSNDNDEKSIKNKDDKNNNFDIDEIIADEEIDSNQNTLKTKNKKRNNVDNVDNDDNKNKDDKNINSINKPGFNFNYTSESRIEQLNKQRMKEKIFLEKLSTDYFKIYADEDDFIVIADFPYGKDNTTYTVKFVNEFKLEITFKNKINDALMPVRYEITFPEATKKEVFNFSVRDKLELIVPMDFFYEERKNFR